VDFYTTNYEKTKHVDISAPLSPATKDGNKTKAEKKSSTREIKPSYVSSHDFS